MTKLLSAAATALLLATGFGHANGLVPGSDTTVRERQSAEDYAVATGQISTGTVGESVYGYAGREGARRDAPSAATNTADERAVDRASGVRSLPRAALVPASDRF